jgi:hypothetical protein
MEDAMRTHRFGRKLKLPSTIAVKHQIRMLMFEDALKNIETAGGAESGVGRELTGEVPAVALARDDSIGVRKVAVANSTCELGR